MGDSPDIDEDEIDEHALFDTSDMSFDLVPRKGKHEVLLMIKAEKTISLLRFYLGLRSYLQQIENEIGVHDEVEADH